MSSSFTPEERNRAEEIKRALGQPSTQSNEEEPVNQARTDWAAIGFGLASVAVVAIGLLLMIRRPAAEPEPPVTAIPAPALSTPVASQPASTPPPSQKVVQVLVPQPVAQPAARSSPAPVKRATPPVSAAPARSLVQSAAPAERSVDPSAEHERVARDYAQNHFLYKYQLGSGYVAIRSVNIEVDDCSEVPMWNRYRTTGEAGIEYFDSPGRVFNRTTRKFEVLTEEHNGRIRAFEITVK